MGDVAKILAKSQSMDDASYATIDGATCDTPVLALTARRPAYFVQHKVANNVQDEQKNVQGLVPHSHEATTSPNRTFCPIFVRQS